MLNSSAEAARAIEGRFRTISHLLNVDWARSGDSGQPLYDLSKYVTRTSRDQALAGTAPEEVFLVEGSAAGALQIEMSGEYEGRPLSAQFAPYSGYSTFYNYEEGIPLSVPVYYYIGIEKPNGDTEWFRQFTGMVKEVEIDRETNTVILHCLDNVEQMRNAFSVSPYAEHKNHLARGDKRGGLIDSSSLIDLAARSGGFVQGRRGSLYVDKNINTLLSVPFHGSFLPEVGMMDNIWSVHRTEVWENNSSKRPRAEAYVKGPFGLLALNAVPLGADNEPVGVNDTGGTIYEDTAVKKYWIDPQVIPPEGDRYRPWGSWGFSAMVRWDGAGTSPTKRIIDLQVWNWHIGVSVNGSNGNVNGTWQGPSGTAYFDNSIAQPLQSGWNEIDVRFSTRYEGSPNNIIVTCHVSVNGAPITSATVYSGSWTFAYDRLNNLAVVRNDYAISDVSLRWTPSSDWWQYLEPYRHVQDSASIDWGRNRLMYTKRLDNISAWDLAKEVAAAEYGVVYFDEYGKFHFRNFESVQELQKSAPARTFDIDTVSGLSMRVTSDSVRNVWSTETRTAHSRWGIAYDLNEDGPPLYTEAYNPGNTSNPGELLAPSSLTNFTVADFRVGGAALGNSRYFWIPAPELLVCPDPNNINNAGTWDEEWVGDTPQHLRKTYTGNNFRTDNDWLRVGTRQIWYGRDFVQLNVVKSDTPDIIGFWLNDKNVGRFRMRGTMIYEDEVRPLEFTTNDLVRLGDTNSSSLLGQSVSRYGRRVIELKGNRWLQDSFQTLAMLRKVMAKFGRPIPVTDRIVVPGDPRIQLGDVIKITDPDGYGGNISLQIYGIERELDDGVGLRDTYQVEVIQAAGTGLWDDEEYGLWDHSLIWS